MGLAGQIKAEIETKPSTSFSTYDQTQSSSISGDQSLVVYKPQEGLGQSNYRRTAVRNRRN